MENCRGMERDRYFCGSVSTTRSHTRNQDTPQWNKRFVSMAAHFGAVTVAITEIGLLKCFSDSHWQILSCALTLTRSFAIFLHFFFFFFSPNEKREAESVQAVIKLNSDLPYSEIWKRIKNLITASYWTLSIFHCALETFSQLLHYVVYLLKWLGCQNKQAGWKRGRIPRNNQRLTQKRKKKRLTVV